MAGLKMAEYFAYGSATVASAGIEGLAYAAYRGAGALAVREVTRTTLKPLGLGSTGRVAAANLTEQLAMKEIISSPSSGKVLIRVMKDASGRWSGWSKMSNKTAHGVEIHYNALWENGVIKSIDDFKFIGGK